MMDPTKKKVCGKFRFRPETLREKKASVCVYASTLEQWNCARESMEMTQDNFMMFLLVLYDKTRGVGPKIEKSLGGGCTNWNAGDLMKAAIRSNEKTSKKCHPDQQV